MKNGAILPRLSCGAQMLVMASRARAFAKRPSLLAITAGFAGLTAFANAMAAGADPAPTRMGVSIQQSMGERDQALAKQKRGLELREQATRAAEARLKASVEARKTTAANAENPALAAQAQAAALEENAQPFDDLARIYQTMKPGKAAPIFERLDLDVQLQIARRMRERSTALILSSMSPNAAVQLSMALAGHRIKPTPAAVPASAPRVDPVKKGAPDVRQAGARAPKAIGTTP
ncbi:MotE family protein [Sphingobium boeckii]|uniref:Flagellar motility protein MotE (MotC chaperone) n=1 Tax=Sphingobium boeckii TaxID=1082345 RepID=A0A7W9AGT9_9SPHN|nr:magnesium transporter [Sphingobium boeckii]MBB5685257.1 flagellar motility protein MotE (MotC chaperone) [Sphingobium boeckii]